MGGGGGGGIGRHISNTITIWQLSTEDEKSIPAGKIYILWEMADLIPHLDPTLFQESILPHILSKKQKYRLRLLHGLVQGLG